MNNPGIYSLGDATVAAAVTDEVITSGVSSANVAQEFIDRLEGALAVTLFCDFVYGSGGTAVKVDIETWFTGSIWVPIARFAFTTASARKIMSVSGLTARLSAATPSTLSDDTALDGCLGPRLRAKITSTGTYAGNTSVSVRASMR
ncbi:MAG: hypothetical protein AB7F22_10610 [Reyranella sp.]|uniref:hypothetical protein n=1 Tax=Reyranella sp. TaxID=1929291 RepID=UPI003D114D8B